MRRSSPLAAVVGLVMLTCAVVRAQAWDPDAVYERRVAELKAVIDANPDDPDALVALAAFYLKPLAEREVEAADGRVRRVLCPLKPEVRGPIKDIYAVPWVFRGDPASAGPLLKRALQLNPRHARAHREMAMYHRMRNDLDSMRPYMEAYLRHDPLDLDMCRLYLDHRTALAFVLNQQATQLRTPRVWHEDRADGKRYEVTSYPSEADHARAKQLDEQAQQARRDAIQPLQNLAGALKNDRQLNTDPAKSSKWRLATAIYFHWIGELDKAAGTAGAALREDPTNLDALDYVVDILRGTHTKGKLAEYKPILDRWSGRDSSPVIVRSEPKGPRR